MATLRKQVMHHAKSQKQEISSEALSDDVMQKMIEFSSVDIYPVLLPKKDVGHVGVSLYVDDKGISKKLPVNKRAMSLCMPAGHEVSPFFGDAFIARVFDDEDAW